MISQCGFCIVVTLKNVKKCLNSQLCDIACVTEKHGSPQVFVANCVTPIKNLRSREAKRAFWENNQNALNLSIYKTKGDYKTP